VNKAQPQGIDGLVVVEKEAGWTSHDVVARCRRIYGQRRIGHAGTLDPDATGVLLVGLGRATRLLRYLTDREKSYTCEVVLGQTTSTLDASGEVTGTFDVDFEDAALEAAIATLTGPILQVPPMVSAIKIDGKRLHELARQGVEVERPARPVTVSKLTVERTPDPEILLLDATVSSGTYIRVLAQDLGTALNSGAHLRNLRRYRSGSFSEKEARTLDQLTADAETARAQGAIPHSVLTPAQALAHLDQTVVGPEDAIHISRGRPLDRVTIGANGPGPYAIVDGGGNLLAVYEATDTDRIVPAVVLAAQ
jgi:tRNA pseudouridine55 synthase